MTDVSGTSRRLFLVAGVLLMVSALGLGALAMIAAQKPAWMLVGFEVVTLAASLILIVFGAGRIKPAGADMALACIAGTVLVSAGLGYVSVRGVVGMPGGIVGELRILPVTAFRVLVALFLGAMAVHISLGPDRVRRRRFVIAAVELVIPLVIGGALFAIRANPHWTGLAGGVRSMIMLLVLAVCGVLLCAGTDLLVRAFVAGQSSTAPPQDAATQPPKPMPAPLPPTSAVAQGASASSPARG